MVLQEKIKFQKEVHKILKILLSKRLNHLDTLYDYKNSLKKFKVLILEIGR